MLPDLARLVAQHEQSSSARNEDDENRHQKEDLYNYLDELMNRARDESQQAQNEENLKEKTLIKEPK